MVEKVGSNYVKVSVKQKDLEKSIVALQRLKPILRGLVRKGNGANKKQAEEDVKEMNHDFDTAIAAMTMLLSGFADYQ